MTAFDEARLDDPSALADADEPLRTLALAGGRLRGEFAEAERALAGLEAEGRPRAVVVIGPEGRLLRALLEPTLPVPLVAWPAAGLPGWAGPLDLVVVLGGEGAVVASSLREALRRGCRVLLTAPEASDLARLGASRLATLLPSRTTDAFCRAVVALAALARLGLASAPDPQAIASALDEVALESSHTLDIAHNPAKVLALELADTTPLVWGASVLSARASRRIAEAVRSASGRPALAADAAALRPLIDAAPPTDPFSDPFDEGGPGARPRLVLVDAGGDDDAGLERDLRARADAAGVRVSRIDGEGPDELTRYASALQRGRFAAAYLAVGLSA